MRPGYHPPLRSYWSILNLFISSISLLLAFIIWPFPRFKTTFSLNKHPSLEDCPRTHLSQKPFPFLSSIYIRGCPSSYRISTFQIVVGRGDFTLTCPHFYLLVSGSFQYNNWIRLYSAVEGLKKRFPSILRGHL